MWRIPLLIVKGYAAMIKTPNNIVTVKKKKYVSYQTVLR